MFPDHLTIGPINWKSSKESFVAGIDSFKKKFALIYCEALEYSFYYYSRLGPIGARDVQSTVFR